MINKIIGVVAVIATLALIVMTALGAGTYKTMLPDTLFAPSAEVEGVVSPAEPDVVTTEMSAETQSK